MPIRRSPLYARMLVHDTRHGCPQVGDVVWLVAANGTGLVQDNVVAVEAVLAEGMFNPYTAEGASRSSALRLGSHGARLQASLDHDYGGGLQLHQRAANNVASSSSEPEHPASDATPWHTFTPAGRQTALFAVAPDLALLRTVAALHGHTRIKAAGRHLCRYHRS